MNIEELSTLENELRRDIEAIARVRQIMAAKQGAAVSDERQMPPPIRKVDDTVADDIDAPTKSIRGTIESIMNANPSARWTTAKMLARLQHLGVPLKAKQPIYTVGQTMQKLAEQGRIKIIHRGAGSAPNIYRGVDKAPEQASETGDATEDHSETELLPIAG